MRAMVGVGIDSGAPLTVTLSDGVPRCAWVAKPITGLVQYHDLIWGTPTRDESALLGTLAEAILEGGLSWATVFRKRATLSAAFHHFDPDVVAAMTAAEIDLCLTDPGTIRNRRKVENIVHNARMMQVDPPLADVAWSCQPPDQRPLRSWDEGLRSWQEAQSFSTHVQELGYRGVGPTVAHAFLTSIGVLKGHVEGCFRAGSEGAGGERDEASTAPVPRRT